MATIGQIFRKFWSRQPGRDLTTFNRPLNQLGRASFQQIRLDAFKEITKVTLEAAQAIELDAGVILPPGGSRMRGGYDGRAET